MYMNDRKMNNYSVIRVGSVLVLAIALVLATFTFPLGTRTSATPLNSPPVFGNPSPVNGSTGNPVSFTWSIPINDTEGDTFNWTIQCSNGQTTSGTNASNGTKSLAFSDLAYSTSYKVWVNATDFYGSGLYTKEWYTFSTEVNLPPTFGTPTPGNGSTNNTLSLSWSIPINDTEGDLFSWTIQCSNGQTTSGTNASNGTKSLALSSLAYSTTYKVWVNATDPTGSGLYTKEWYNFTTEQEGILTVVITRPLENKFYLNDQEKSISLPGNTFIYGKITITANVSSETDVVRVEFYVDGKLKFNDTEAPYSYLWQPFIQFNGLSLKRTIKVIAYDSQGHNATAELNVTKWRFHALPFIVAGIAMASRLLLHTTVKGLFFNLKESRIAVSFYAIRAHYKTIGPFKSARGVINFKSCMGSILIGPMKLVRFGPFHKFAYGSFTILGEIHYNTGRLGQGILGNLLRNALSK
ncbi:MAG: fibronectin type III domain-containing protein [Thermoplasmata archaeon]|nr:fibronectin type III domain-containing protein [Thermoplasmata archaeon]